MAFSLKIDTKSLELNHNISGKLWLEFEGYSFPESDWIDFPVIVLGWWLQNLEPLFTKKSSRCECPFMDGPYFLEVSIEDNNKWIIRCFRDEGDHRHNVYQSVISPAELTAEMLAAVKAILSFCQNKEWTSRDIDVLESEYRAHMKFA